MVELILDAPVFTDPGGELGSGGRAGQQAGDQVDPLNCQLAGGQVPSPAYDLEGLAGVGVVEVRERSGLEPADFVAVVGPAALVVVQAETGS
ncbi:hypothetical protein OG336_00550 [[Kitasatospora] papulosa]|uniref:hypothetical protein n=1 Tax=[Kitasatospora] papulosa TaxID=1464011 RepID=UPI002E12514B|nr:hypothetical protein OG336_00550 [[Kitasatospora] papulosa]